MTISATYAPLTFNGNDVTTAFSVTFPFYSGTLLVTAIDEDGVETVKTISTHYTVSGGTDANGLASTGTVTMLTAPATDTQLRIERVTPKTQAVTFASNDQFLPKVVEGAFDRNLMIAQEVAATAFDDVTGDYLQLNTAGATDYWDGEGHIVRGISTPTLVGDAATKGYVDDAVSEAEINNALGETVFTQDGASAVDRSWLGKVRERVSVLDYIDVDEHEAIIAFTSTYDATDEIQSALDEHKIVEFPLGRYNVTSLTLNDQNSIVGLGSHGAADAVSSTNAPKLVGTGGVGGAVITSSAASSLLYASISGLAIWVPSTSTYDWIIDIVEPVALNLRDMRIETDDTAIGGLRTAKISSSNSSWVNHFYNVQVKLPDASSARPLDTDMSDSSIMGCSFTGGIGSILRGTGNVQFIGNRVDRSSAYGLTISKETESACTHSITSCQIEVNTTADILVTVDTNDALTNTHCIPVILGNQFRSNSATNSIVLLNASGSAMTKGPHISGNVFAITGMAVPITFDTTKWGDVDIGSNAYARTSVVSLGSNEFSTWAGEIGSTILDRWGIRLKDGFIVSTYNGTAYSKTGVSGFFGVGANDAGAILGNNSGTPFVGASLDSSAVAKNLDFVTNNTAQLRLASDGTSLVPLTTNATVLGSASLSFKGLHLSEGTAINWDNADFTLTQTGNTLAVAGGQVTFAATSTAFCSFNLPSGTAPSSPVDGDVWREDNTDTGLKIRVNGVTKTITLS
jgi:hypothetical protein